MRTASSDQRPVEGGEPVPERLAATAEEIAYPLIEGASLAGLGAELPGGLADRAASPELWVRVDAASAQRRGQAASAPPSGQLTIASRQSIGLHESMAGRLVTVWADLRSVHISAHGHVVRTAGSRLRPEDLRHLTMRGARPAGPPPAKPALRRRNGIPVLPESGAIEIQRTVTKDGTVNIAGGIHLVGFAWAGRKIALRLDGHLMHAIADNALVGSWPCPVTTDRLAAIRGAQIPTTPLPPPPLPAGSLRAQRKVHETGRIMVAGQRIKLGPRHRGKLVTVVIEDTHLRILHGEEEIAVRPRRSTKPITRFHVTGAGAKRDERQASPDDKTSSIS